MHYLRLSRCTVCKIICRTYGRQGVILVQDDYQAQADLRLGEDS